MKIIRYLLFVIIIPILCSLFFAFSTFAAGNVVGLIPNNSQGIAGTNVNNISSLGIPYVSSGSVRVTFCNNSGYSSDRIYVFLMPYGNTKGLICAVSDKSSSISVYNGTSNFNLLWNNPVSSTVNVDGQTFYWTNSVWGSIPNSASYDHLKMFNNVQDAIAYFYPPSPSAPNRPTFDTHTSIGTLKNFKYSLLDSTAFDNIVDNYLQYAGLVDSDLLDYTSGIYQFSWDNTIDLSIRHSSGQGGGNRIVSLPIDAMRIEFGFLNVRTKDYFMQKSFWPIEDGFTNTFNPDFFSISEYIELQLHNYLNVHPVYVFTPVVEYEGERIYGESLFFDMYIKKLAGSSVGGGHQLENITEVTLPDGSTTDVGFGSGSTNLWKFLLDNWDDSEFNIDNSKEQTSYNNYVTNNHGLSIDDILFILTHDPRFQGGDNQIIISPEFDPAGISDDDDLWLGKLRELYQLTLRVPVWANLFIEQLAGMTPWVPSEFYSFLAAVFSVGVVLSIARLIRG